MTTLDQAAYTPIARYDPAQVIAAVNDLQPMGKERALAALQACLERRETSADAIGLFWVTRVLFDVPARLGFPPVAVGTPDVAPPPRPHALPRFPIVTVRDIPLLVVCAYYLRGLPEPVDHHLAYYHAHGTVRERPLEIPASLAGVEGAFVDQWAAAYANQPPGQTLEAVTAQLARLAEACPRNREAR